MKICTIHGKTEFVAEKQNSKGDIRYRCKQCRYSRQVTAYEKRKCELVLELGGKCENCGYDKYLGALDFHHKDPSIKSFSISEGIIRYSKTKLMDEAKKCSLLCRNCHAEIENKGWYKKALDTGKEVGIIKLTVASVV